MEEMNQNLKGIQHCLPWERKSAERLKKGVHFMIKSKIAQFKNHLESRTETNPRLYLSSALFSFNISLFKARMNF